MCGIAGLFATDAAGHDEDAAIDLATRMLAWIEHRGPDEAGVFADARAALGAVRLAILDLAGGHQPMGDASGRFVLAYNGEVYNYRELAKELEAEGHAGPARGDTEVVLRALIAWGRDALARFDGPFALALYDRDEATLLLARDRFGKRPLYFTEVAGAIAFASELKAFLADPRVRFELDDARLATIFTLWTPLPRETPFSGLDQIAPGHALLVRAGGARVESRFANVAWFGPRFAGSLDDAATATRDLLADAVRLRLRSDVEVATYLSGGLDSAIVTALAKESGAKNLRSFSIAFDDAELDESKDQDELARHLGTNHETLLVRGDDIARAFPAAVFHAEVPVFRTAFVPMFLLSERVRAAGIKVVLTGEGADEGFLGYDIFKETLVRGSWAAKRDPEALRGLYPYLSHFQGANLNALAAVFDRFATEKRRGLFSHELRFSNSLFGVRLLARPSDGLAAIEAHVAAEAATFDRLGPVERAQWLELETLLAGYLLSTQGDRMSMAHGVETRCPFLDPRVFDFALGLPEAMRLGPGLDEKHILKRAFEDLLPPRSIRKPKQPYRAPDAPALLAGGDAFAEEFFSDAALAEVGALDATFSGRFVAKVREQPGAISQRDNQALVLLASLVAIHRFFVARRPPFGPRPGFSAIRRQNWK